MELFLGDNQANQHWSKLESPVHFVTHMRKRRRRKTTFTTDTSSAVGTQCLETFPLVSMSVSIHIVSKVDINNI